MTKEIDFWNGKKKISVGAKLSSNKLHNVNFLGQNKPVDWSGRKGPWGDRDMDGSMNKFDCSPNNPGKDGIMARILNVATFGHKGQSKNEYRAKQRRNIISNKPTGLQRFAATINPSGYAEQRQRVKGLYKQRLIAGRESALRRIKESNPEDSRIPAMEKYLVRARDEYSKNYAKNQEDKNQRELRKVQEQLKRLKNTGETKEPSTNTKLKRILNAAGVPVQGKQQGTRASGVNKGGRPYGSVKYSIPGKGPVGVYEWRKWNSQQNRMRRMQGQAPLPREAYMEYQKQLALRQMAEQQVGQPYQPSEVTSQQVQEYAQSQGDAQTPEEYLPQDNKFVQLLNQKKMLYDRDVYDRMKNEQPKDFVKKLVQLKREEREQQSDFAKRNSLLNAHKNMLSPEDNKAIDLFENSILDSTNNNIMRPVEGQINILKTNRPSILSAQPLRNVDDGNILRAERLNFGKVNVEESNYGS